MNAMLEKGRWAHGDLPANVSLGIGTLILMGIQSYVKSLR